MTDEMDRQINAIRMIVRDEASTIIDASAMVSLSVLFTLLKHGALPPEAIHTFREQLEGFAKAQDSAGVGDMLQRTLTMLSFFGPKPPAN